MFHVEHSKSTMTTAYPEVRKTLRGIYNLHGQPVAKAPALPLAQLAQLCQSLQTQTGLKAVRDNAMLQIQFFGALRVSDLLAMQVSWLDFTPQGLQLRIPRSNLSVLQAAITISD